MKQRAKKWLLTALVLMHASTELRANETPETPVRGVVRAVHQAAISTELTVRVAKINVRDGESFEANDVLLEFDCRRQIAHLAASDAQQLEMQVTADKLRMLQRAQSVGKSDLEIAEARLLKAKAESDALRSQLDQCRVIAPFPGRVTEVNVNAHESVQPGKPFLTIVGTHPIEVDLIVPSTWVRWLKTGVSFEFLVDETARSLDVTVARLGAVVDPISQTIKLTAKVTGTIDGVLPGMSGTARLRPPGSGP
jgi:membrane fusion protein, multidrug efflux system